MTRIVIDARLAGHAGIGVYIDHVVPRVAQSLADWRPLVFTGTAMRAQWSARLGATAEVSAWDVPALGVRNLWSVPPVAEPHLVWTPHFNVPLRGKAPLAVTLQDLLPLTAPRLAGRGRSFPVRLWLHAIRARARIVFCISEFTRREAMARGGLDSARLVVTPLGVDDPWRAAPSPPAPVNDDHSEPTIVFVGLLKRHKNVSRLLQAFERIKSAIPHRLVLVARSTGLRGIDTGALQRIRALADRVVLVDHLPLADLVAQVRSAQFIVLPSLHEGFGLPALEAMAVGTPVLAARAGALPEVCGDAAVYCDPESVDDIARGLLLLASDRALRTRLSAAGLARSSAFTWDRCSATTADALARELRRHCGGRQP